MASVKQFNHLIKFFKLVLLINSANRSTNYEFVRIYEYLPAIIFLNPFVYSRLFVFRSQKAFSIVRFLITQSMAFRLDFSMLNTMTLTILKNRFII
ncbi:MAG: hypothetical protein Athens101410_141 [Parcubacteria group bacterium Athens1014_10]|nr:MAG: hypothetical protein Athens101410_141 [Parcubacteria group bacterium Athens1014_10]TSD05890.1 MAG: hypothetical protein Athens071412_172 [Parcubacteria group bacterium Athens0714_12]